MRPIGDIREYKKNLRNIYRKKRIEINSDSKKRMDNAILNNILSLEEYMACQTVVVYVSTSIEVDTRELINMALFDGKRVSVPRCVPGTREMEFYYINSLDELKKGSFAVDEPNPDKSEQMTDFEQSICIVPGLCYDKEGYRLGYGKGYYDRFLAGYFNATIGICYTSCICDKIVRGRYDHNVDKVVTERYIINTDIKKEKYNNGRKETSK